MPTALVTGANRGLGLATARALARTGACVVLAGRNPARVEDAAASLRAEGLDATAIELDVTVAGSVADAAVRVAEEQGHLDILINNAGILPEATDTAASEFANPRLFEATFATNLFGAVAVIEAFLPLLRRSAMPRIVNVSTTMGSQADQADPSSPWYPLAVPAYRASKAALNSVTLSLSKALSDTDVKVTSVCPGWVQTDLAPGNRANAPLSADEAAEVVVAAATLAADAPSGTFIDRDGVVPW